MPDWTKVDFDRFYSSQAERWGRPNNRPPIVLHYHWFPIIQYQQTLATRIRDVLGLVPGDRVVLVGAGFNGSGAGLTALGIEVVGTETSAYILAEKNNTEEAEVRAAIVAAGLNPDVDLIIGPNGRAEYDPLNLFLEGGRASPALRGKGNVLAEDGATRPSRNAIRNALSGNPRYLISEEVLNSITDAQVLLVCDAAARLVSEAGGTCTIVHMLSPLNPDAASQEPDLNWKTYAQWRALLNANGFSAQKILPTVTASNQGSTPLSQTIGDRVDVVTAYSGIF